MKSIKSYPTTVEADIARMALEAAGVPSVVVGIGVGMEGGRLVCDCSFRMIVSKKHWWCSEIPEMRPSSR